MCQKYLAELPGLSLWFYCFDFIVYERGIIVFWNYFLFSFLPVSDKDLRYATFIIIIIIFILSNYGIILGLSSFRWKSLFSILKLWPLSCERGRILEQLSASRGVITLSHSRKEGGEYRAFVPSKFRTVDLRLARWRGSAGTFLPFLVDFSRFIYVLHFSFSHLFSFF